MTVNSSARASIYRLVSRHITVIITRINMDIVDIVQYL